jgi:hypothetical protein
MLRLLFPMPRSKERRGVVDLTEETPKNAVANP